MLNVIKMKSLIDDSVFLIEKCLEVLKRVYLRKKYNINSINDYFSEKKKIDEHECNSIICVDEDLYLKHCDDLKYLRTIGGLIRLREWNYEKKRERDELKSVLFSDNTKTFEDYKCEIEYLRRCGEIRVFPYPFIEKYNLENRSITVKEMNGLNYVMHNNRPLFFSESSKENVINEYLQLIMEQDSESPHKYFSDTVSFSGGIFVDVGSAEGIISLEIVDMAKEIYILEGTKEWIAPLQETFRNYADKVHIIPKYVGCMTDDITVTLDYILGKYKDEKIFIKMDVEGMEVEVLRGCINTLKNNNCSFSCACYHTNTMEKRLIDFFKLYDYNVEISNGYMLFVHGIMTLRNGMYEKMEYPYFRRGLVRAYK